MVKKDKVLPLQSVNLFLQDLKDALAYLHENGYLHNDFCANNFILSSNGVLKLVEFEPTNLVAKTTSLSADEIEFSIRKNGYLHRAPETLLEQGCYSYESDLFSLGCTIYYIAFNKYPFAELDKGDYQEYAKEVLEKGEEHLKHVIPPIDTREAEFPSEFYELLFMLLQPVPFERGGWDEINVNKIFTQVQDCAMFKPQSEPVYCAFLEKACEDGVFGQEKTDCQFDKRGNLIVAAEVQLEDKAVSAKEVVEQELQRVKRATNEADEIPMDLTDLSQAPDMTIKQVKKQTELYYLVDQVDQYYKELKDLVEAEKFDSFIARWMRQFTPLVLSRNNNLKQERLIELEAKSTVHDLENANYETLSKLEGEEYLSELEIMLTQERSDNVFKFKTDDSIVDFFNYLLQMMHCTYLIREKRSNESKINPKLFESANVFERTIICITVLLFEYREDFVQEFYVEPIDGIFEVMRFIIENELYENEPSCLALFCEILTLIYTLLTVGALQQEYVEEELGQRLQELHSLFTENINNHFLAMDFLNASRDGFVQYLSRCIIYFTFCTNISLELVSIEQTSRLKCNIFKELAFTDFLIAAQNIFMFIHQDNFVSSLKQKSGILVSQLPLSCTVASSMALTALTDLRLHGIIRFGLVVPSYFDFPKVMHDVFATRNVLEALIQSFLLERFATLDIEGEEFVLSSQPLNRTEKFIYDNYYRLLNLEQFPAQDDQLLALVAALLSAIFIADIHSFRSYKNCSNATSSKLAEFINMPDAHFERNFDEMVYRCGIKSTNEFLLQSVGQLVLSIQFFVNGVLNSVGHSVIRGEDFELGKLQTCGDSLELISRYLISGCEYSFLIFTEEQIKSLEYLLSAVANAIIVREIPPTGAQTALGATNHRALKTTEPDENSEITDTVENALETLDFEEICSLVERVLSVLQSYLAYPLAKCILPRLLYSENGEIKGLYLSLLNLSKDPLKICVLPEREPKSASRKLMGFLRTETVQLLDFSLAKLLHFGHILPYIQHNTEFELTEGIYKACADNPQAAILTNRQFSEAEARSATELVKTLLFRFIESKSIFAVSLAKIDRRTELALKIALEALELGVKSDTLREVAEKCLKQPPAIAKIACEIVEIFISADSGYWLRHIGKLEEYAKKPDIYIYIIRCCLEECRKIAEKAVLETGDRAMKILGEVKYVDISEMVAICMEATTEFFEQTLFGQDANIIVKLQVVALYYVLFLRFVRINEETLIEMLESFASCVAEGRTFEETVYDAILDVMQQVSTQLVAGGWTNFEFVCSQIKDNVNERQRFRLEQIRMNSIPVEWPEGWFE